MPESLTLSPGRHFQPNFSAEKEKWQGRPFGSAGRDASPVALIVGAPEYRGQADVPYGWPFSKRIQKQQLQGRQFHVGRTGELKPSRYDVPPITYQGNLLLEQVEQTRHIAERPKTSGDEWLRHLMREPSPAVYRFDGQEPSEGVKQHQLHLGQEEPFGTLVTFCVDALPISTSRSGLLGQTVGRARGTHSRRHLGFLAHSALHSLHRRVMRKSEEPANFKAAVGVLDRVRETAADMDYEVPSPLVIANARQVLARVCDKDSREFYVYPMPYGGISIDAATPRRTRVIIICGPDGTAQGLVGRDMEVESKDYSDIGEVPDAFILDALADLSV